MEEYFFKNTHIDKPMAIHTYHLDSLVLPCRFWRRKNRICVGERERIEKSVRGNAGGLWNVVHASEIQYGECALMPLGGSFFCLFQWISLSLCHEYSRHYGASIKQWPKGNRTIVPPTAAEPLFFPKKTLGSFWFGLGTNCISTDKMTIIFHQGLPCLR